MILKIAWRNIWRSPLRSMTVMVAVVIGVWGLLFFLAFFKGFIDAYIQSAIENELSHVQIHHKEFKEDRESSFFIEGSSSLESVLSEMDGIQSVSARMLYSGMLSTARGAKGVEIRGIDPLKEAQQTHLDEKLIDGDYFTSTKKRNPIIVGSKLAETLSLKVKSKLVLTFQNQSGDIQQASYKVIGIFKTGNSFLDAKNVFVSKKDLQAITTLTSDHEIAITLQKPDELETMIQSIETQLGMNKDIMVESYLEISPDVRLYSTQLDMINGVIIFIILLALIFGIINTMLMAVLERTKEFGMLMAVGMRRFAIFKMILFETLILVMTAAPVGMLFGFLTIQYFGTYGMDLSSFQEGMDMIGISSILYTRLDLPSYVQVTVSVAFMACLAAIYPARKAIRLKPVDAIRKI